MVVDQYVQYGLFVFVREKERLRLYFQTKRQSLSSSHSLQFLLHDLACFYSTLVSTVYISRTVILLSTSSFYFYGVETNRTEQ